MGDRGIEPRMKHAKVTFRYGLSFVKARRIAKAYQICYRQLKEQLAPMIPQATNVITHNPWDENEYEEHVLVHRVVTKLSVRA